ncbi:MAG: hypothetical protein GY859_04440 [Desulfobacterales bacterium]|nr:hypothetical protein [Desulfobacterales bacterium]
MKCKCGGIFDINPSGKDGVESGQPGAGPDKVETPTFSAIDARRDDAIIIVVDCPFCGGMKSKMIRYNELLDLPGPDDIGWTRRDENAFESARCVVKKRIRAPGMKMV